MSRLRAAGDQASAKRARLAGHLRAPRLRPLPGAEAFAAFTSRSQAVYAHLTARRIRSENLGDVYLAGELEVRPDEQMVLVADRPLQLTVRELALLSELARQGNRVVTRAQLFESVWGRRWRSSDRSVDVYVSRLRNKLSTALPETSFIHTHFGIGYRFAPEPSRSDESL